MVLIMSLLPKFIILAGLTIWLGIAAINNVIDRTTNVNNLEDMLTMSLLSEDPNASRSLGGRAWRKGCARTLLSVIIALQVTVTIAMTCSTLGFLLTMLGRLDLRIAVCLANVGLSAFAGIWLFFMCGGLWFAYWIKQGLIQSVHLNLLLLSIAALIFVNAGATTVLPFNALTAVKGEP